MSENRQLDFAEAIREAIRQEMKRDKTVFVLGEDVGKFGGIFGCTKGLQEEFGEERIRDTPISETAIIGAAVGAAVTGMHPIAELEFMDFIGCGMDQVFNQMAKIRYMFGGSMSVPVVLRTPCGSRYPVACGAAHHSQSLEAWFIHVPGLKVAVPSTPYDAKGLLITAIRGQDPVLFVEHKLLYYAKRMPKLREPYPNLIANVPEEPYSIPFGKAEVKRPGEDVTVIATMMMVHKALRVAEDLAKMGISIEIVDPRTLVPFDKETIVNSVKKTGRVVVASEDAKTGGVAAEISSIIMEEAFDYLDAPVKRVSALDLPVPYAPALESTVVPQERHIREAVIELTGQK
ncbi:MAG TPA: alpha-ketoacid dehydrogenase subunit beta [Methylomirabilota bacterium]|nr:alpha-ketoacid dehydrogenase subunit beta [Methylomirabilota bacterium]